MKPLTFITLILISRTNLSAQDIIPEPPDRRSGYININELSVGYGLGSTEISNSKYFYGFTTIHGYEFDISPFNIKSGLSVGAGAGMLFYDNGAMFPLFADMRYTIIRKKISPFVLGNGGLLINPDDLRDQSMFAMNGGLGARIRLNDKLDLSICTGLFVQFSRSDTRDTFLNLRTGVTFKPGHRAAGNAMLVRRNE